MHDAATWAIRPEYALFVADTQRAADVPSTYSMRRALPATGERRIRLGNSVVAVLPFHGVAVQRASELGAALGFVSVDRFARSFRAALADGSVSGIVIDIDSPGGGLQAIAELADEIYQARGGKPVAAVANSIAAGAAYWIASAASNVYITPGGEVGSIGVFATHQDYSKALENEGVKTTLISAGRYKTEGSPFAPLSPSARQHLQARVNDDYDRFARAVSRNRGVDVVRVRNGMGQGRILGAQAATDEMMVDGVATLDEVVSKLAQRVVPVRPKLFAIGLLCRPNAEAPF
ncbi:S49 family peptidase [Paraburkholderia lacunae]|uniref:Peptidase S49 n=1 Tax=Paraburkholderia lacunae TaxID=2211104 RepID=A0A370NFZ1_9BURK|nr:S49 family peptidase [Paraburkholderia lacunae]RDK04475.1 peptidase S49 [Paraburkholderia lacunae]